MKNTIISSFILIALFASSCKNNNKKNPPLKSDHPTTSVSDKPLLAQAGKITSTGHKTFYVTASSGLSLRAASNLNSKKLLILPFGAQVQFLSSPSHTEMEVAGINGKMVEIEYQGAKGFAFDGYLSSLAPPQTDEAIEDYARRISTEKQPIEVLKSSSKKGESYGMNTSIEIPAKSWNEMYKITQTLFDLPKSLRPDFTSKMEAIVMVNKNKRERTLKDELSIVVTEDEEVESLVYFYKLREYARRVTITKTDSGFRAFEEELSL